MSSDIWSMLTPPAWRRRSSPSMIAQYSGVTRRKTASLAFLKRLKTWPVFGRGWGRRVAEVRAACLRMAAERAPVPVPDIEIAPAAGKGAVPAHAAAKKVVVGTGRAGPAAAGGAFGDWVAAHPWEAAAIGCGLVLVVGGSLVLMERLRRRRQEAAIPATPFVPPRRRRS